MTQDIHKPMPDHNSWPEFVMPRDDNTESVTDMSYITGQDGSGSVAESGFALGDHIESGGYPQRGVYP
jgi:hypothetical protein